MAEKGADRGCDRKVSPQKMLGDQHRRGALEYVADKGRGSQPLAAGAQNVGGADIAGANGTKVGAAAELRQQDAERDRAAQIAEDESRDEGRKPLHGDSVLFRSSPRKLESSTGHGNKLGPACPRMSLIKN